MTAGTDSGVNVLLILLRQTAVVLHNPYIHATSCSSYRAAISCYRDDYYNGMICERKVEEFRGTFKFNLISE